MKDPVVMVKKLVRGMTASQLKQVVKMLEKAKAK